MSGRRRRPDEPPEDELDLEDLGITVEFRMNYGGESPPWVIRLDQSPPEGFTVCVAESVKVVGVQRRRRQVESFVSGRNQRITLRREPDNPSDPNAIRVLGTWLDDEGHEHTAELGYLPRDEAAVIAEVAPDKPLAATIQRMFLPRGDKSPGLRLDIWTVGEGAMAAAAAAAVQKGRSQPPIADNGDDNEAEESKPGCGCCGCLTVLALLLLIILLAS